MEEWEALPWWVAQMYWDNLIQELQEAQQQQKSKGQQEEEFDKDSSAGRLASMGAKVRKA